MKYAMSKDRLHIGKIYNYNPYREPGLEYAIYFDNDDDVTFVGANGFIGGDTILELLESGDYVNGRRIKKIPSGEDCYIKIEDYEMYFEKGEEIEQIPTFKGDHMEPVKKITTKEQLEKISFRI